jgi:hypothetical protein
MESIEHYTWEAQLVYRLIACFIYFFRSYFERAVEERAQEIVALKAPRIFWTGFGVGAFVVIILLFGAMSRQPVG